MTSKALAVLLSLALTGLSAGLAPYEALAAEIAPVRVDGAASGIPALPNSALGVTLRPSGLGGAPVSGLQGSLRSLPSAPKVSVSGVQAQVLPQAALLGAPSLQGGLSPLPEGVPAIPAAAQTPFEQSLQRLQAPSLVQEVPAEAGAEVSAEAASRDFARRLGGDRLP